MADFLLLHGAASTGWLWHRVAPLLAERGHRCTAPDLPVEDPAAGLDDYVEAACRAVADRPDRPVVVVAQSLAGLLAPLVAGRRPVAGIALLAAMIPAPGESGEQWWSATGQGEAQRRHLAGLGLDPDDAFDPQTVFVHDFSDQLAQESLLHVRDQQAAVMTHPSPISAWPGLPTLVIAAADDRLFPLPFMRSQARARLGLDPLVVPGGHLAALSRPVEVAEALGRFADTLSAGR